MRAALCRNHIYCIFNVNISLFQRYNDARLFALFVIFGLKTTTIMEVTTICRLSYQASVLHSDLFCNRNCLNALALVTHNQKAEEKMFLVAGKEFSINFLLGKNSVGLERKENNPTIYYAENSSIYLCIRQNVRREKVSHFCYEQASLSSHLIVISFNTFEMNFASFILSVSLKKMHSFGQKMNKN